MNHRRRNRNSSFLSTIFRYRVFIGIALTILLLLSIFLLMRINLPKNNISSASNRRNDDDFNKKINKPLQGNMSLPLPTKPQQHTPKFFRQISTLETFVLEKKINERLQIASDLSKKEQSSLNCDLVRTTLFQAAKNSQSTKAAVERVMADNIGFVCTTNENIEKITGRSASAYFDFQQEKIFLSSAALSEALVRHEVEHADNYVMHGNPPCFAKNAVDAVLPLYPATAENIKKYDEALDRGDARIREFKEIYEKEALGKRLSEVEKINFKQYKEAAKDCLMPLFREHISSSAYETLLKLGWKPGLKGFRFPMKIKGETMEVVDIVKTDAKITIIIQSTQPEFSVFHILDKIPEKIIHGSYAKEGKKIKLAERSAFTFEGLSDQAKRVFYPEVLELLEHDMEQCRPRNAM